MVDGTSLAEVDEFSVNYDQHLPQYKTVGGAHHGPDGTVTTPTIVWVHALHELLEQMKKASFDFARVAAVSGSGQQHGRCVYARERVKKVNTRAQTHAHAPTSLSLCFT